MGTISRDQIQAEALDVRAAAKLLGVSVRTIFALAASDPRFPKSVRVSPSGRSRRWVKAELLEYLTKSAERDQPPARRRAGAA